MAASVEPSPMAAGGMARELEIFKACADATRLRILALLGAGELCVCEIVDVLCMPQAKVSRHLAVLRAAGLVNDRRVGTWIHYSLRVAADTQPRDGETAAGATSPLWQRLCDWLRDDARSAAADDLERLQALCDCGEICAPRPTPSAAAEAG